MASKGIDISGWQAGFNIGAVDADFVFIKATGGATFTSAEFALQTASAEASGKRHGFYHYAQEAGCAADPITEANHFLATVAGHVGPGTGIALDWEQANLWDTGWVKQWLDHVATALGRDPSTIFVYMSQAIVNAYDWSGVYNAGYRLWVAQYPTMAVQGYGPLTGPPQVRWGGQGLTMWQYTSAGRVNGWGGNLDLNILYTDWDSIHVSGQAGTITPIEQDWFTMATLDDLRTVVQDVVQTLLKPTQDRVTAGIPQGPARQQVPGNARVADNGDVWDIQQAIRNVPAAVLNQPFTTPAGTSTNLAGILAQIDAKPALTTAPAAVDVNALAAKLTAILPPALVSALAAKLSQP